MSGSWMLAFGGQNRGAQNSEMRRGARSEYEAENRSREAERFMPGAKRQIFDPDKFMPFSPVSPGTPQQPTRAMPMNARGGSGAQNRMGFPVGEEYEAQMHGGESSQAEGGELAHLHKYVKKLAQRLSHIEGGGEYFAKASGGNLMGKELFKKLPSPGRKALKVLKRPPESGWSIWKMKTSKPSTIWRPKSWKRLSRRQRRAEKKPVWIRRSPTSVRHSSCSS